MTKGSGGNRTIFAVLLLCVVTAIAAQAQTFNTLVNFDGTDGANPDFMDIVQGPDGRLYGTTLGGTVFKMTLEGTLTASYPIGSAPTAGLTLASDRNLYGTTNTGGDACGDPYGCGTIFRITPGGRLTTLHSFNDTEGKAPYAGVIQATDGNLYGTTSAGGNMRDCHDQGCGTIFRVTATGNFTMLFAFGPESGAYPFGNLLQASDGSLYGTTAGETDVNHPDGTVFRISPSGVFKTVHAFNFSDGLAPYDGLIQASDGSLYGTTWGGGANGNYGTIFKITPDGTLTTLYSFCSQPNCADGAFPDAGVIQGTDGNFYGTTSAGGTDLTDCTVYSGGCGTIFKITPEGALTSLHSFDSTDGASPYGGLVQATNGVFYGATFYRGAHDLGTVYSLDMGFGPFVTFVRPAGKVGQTGGILGQGFTGTYIVSLNGIPANFTVVSDTFIRATVPAGAKTGFVTVTTPSGTLTSNVQFHVIH